MYTLLFKITKEALFKIYLLFKIILYYLRLFRERKI